jgi:PAS domain-containing protein
MRLGLVFQKALAFLFLLLLISRVGGVAAAKESVRAELVRLQRSMGLALVAVNSNSIQIVSFEDRNLRTRSIEGAFRPVGSIGGTMSPDGSLVALAAFPQEGSRELNANGDAYSGDYLVIWAVDNNSAKKYPDLRNPEEFCWSRDAKSLAFRSKRVEKLTNNVTQGLFALNVQTGEINFIDPLGRVSTSCWSPDAGRIAYSAEQEVRVFDLREKKSKPLTKGAGPSWSPDGKWISYAEEGSFWIASPVTQESKLLFRDNRALGLLGWSPDSRFVAYLSRPSFFQSFGAKMEEHRLWVRRIEDGDEAWVYRYTGKSGSVRWHWVTNVFPPRLGEVHKP